MNNTMDVLLFKRKADDALLKLTIVERVFDSYKTRLQETTLSEESLIKISQDVEKVYNALFLYKEL